MSACSVSSVTAFSGMTTDETNARLILAFVLLLVLKIMLIKYSKEYKEKECEKRSKKG